MSLPKPYPPTKIKYTDWDAVIDALESILGTGAAGPITVDVISEKTGATGVTIDGVLLKDNAITLPSLTVGRIPIVGTGGLLGDDSDFTFSGDTLTVTKIAGTVFSNNITIGDTFGILTGNADDDYITIRARDNGVSRIEVARAQGGVEPYFSFGTSQENKFYHNGSVSLGGNVTIQGATPPDLILDNSEVGITRTSPSIYLRGNYWNDPNNYQIQSQIRVSGGSNPYLEILTQESGTDSTLTTIACFRSEKQQLLGNLEIDNITTGANGNSPTIYLQGNEWTDPTNSLVEATLQLISGDNPYLQIKVDDASFDRQEILRLESAKIGFFGVTAASQVAHLADPGNEAENSAAIATLIDALKVYGLMAADP